MLGSRIFDCLPAILQSEPSPTLWPMPLNSEARGCPTQEVTWWIKKVSSCYGARGLRTRFSLSHCPRIWVQPAMLLQAEDWKGSVSSSYQFWLQRIFLSWPEDLKAQRPTVHLPSFYVPANLLCCQLKVCYIFLYQPLGLSSNLGIPSILHLPLKI